MTFFDDLPTPPDMMPLFRYRKLVTEREARRKDAAQEELDRLNALTDEDRAWLTDAGADLEKLRSNAFTEILMTASYL
jgi:hypothetical protein